ncbi:uncharacterized protein [Coffea arabica]
MENLLQCVLPTVFHINTPRRLFSLLKGIIRLLQIFSLCLILFSSGSKEIWRIYLQTICQEKIITEKHCGQFCFLRFRPSSSQEYVQLLTHKRLSIWCK